MIHIDPDQIGDQGEGLVITQFWGDTLNHQMYDGYEISTLCDVRDIRRGNYQLSFIAKPGNMFSFTKPLLPATYADQADRAAYEEKETNAKVKQGHNAVRVTHSQLTAEQKRRTIRVAFPETMQLSDTPYGSAPTRLRILSKTVPYTSTTGINATDAQNQAREIRTLQCRLTWKVVDMETAREVTADDHDEDADILNSFSGLQL
jgi:hypothetical protein